MACGIGAEGSSAPIAGPGGWYSTVFPLCSFTDERRIDAMGGSPDGKGQARLRPEMASFRLLVLDFVERYIAGHHASPSQYEIARALDVSRHRVRQAILRLEREERLIRTPGERGLPLPSERQEMIRRLREMGVEVYDDASADRPIRSLPGEPELTYPEPVPDHSGPANGDQHE